MKMSSTSRATFLRFYMAIVAVFGVCTAASTSADQDTERERLSRISHELQLLRLMVQEASVNAESSGRIRFRYDLLGQDIELIQRSIDDHVNAPAQPRSAPALAGDYRK